MIRLRYPEKPVINLSGGGRATIGAVQGRRGPTGPAGPAGVDGTAAPHAATHATGGSDPVTPAAIGAASTAELAALGTWTAYTPTINWTLGNGVLSGRWSQIGKTVQFEIQFTLGSTTVPSGALALGLPAPLASQFRKSFGRVYAYDASGTAHAVMNLARAGATLGSAVTDAGAFLTATSPWTWAAGDTVGVTGTYETT